MSSIFTKIIRRELPAYIVDEDEQFIAFLDVAPLKEGHVLVVPKLEIDYIFDIEATHLSDMIVFSQRVAKKIKHVIPCERIGVAVIGLEVAHAHIHLVPINEMNDLNFNRPKLKLSDENMKIIAEKIRTA